MRPASIAALALTALSAGCIQGLTEIDDPTQQSEIMAKVAFNDLQAPSLTFAALALGAPLAFPASLPLDNGCVYTAATQNFVCATVTFANEITSLSFQLLTAGGAPQSEMGATTTDGVHLQADVLSASPLIPASSTHQHSDYTITGYQAATRVLNGSIVTRSIAGTDTVSTTTVVTTNVSLTTTNPYPIAGTLVAHQQVGTFTTSSTMTFDGTANPPMVKVDQLGKSHTCAVNLASINVPTCTP